MGNQLRDAEILFEAPAGEERPAGWGRRVRLLHFDQAVAPTARQDGGLEVDAVDAESVQFLERRENSPATPSIRSANRAVSSLLSAIGRMSTSMDILAAAGSSDSS